MPDNNQELFTTQEAADLLRYKATTLSVWRSNAEGPAYIKLGRTVRYRGSDLADWLYGGPLARARIEETSDCHVAKRRAGRRLRGRAAVVHREGQLKAEPFCRDCNSHGQVRTAEEVDHITPLADGGTNDKENLRSLCRACHAVRTRERWLKNR